jgi:hypothetical protein
MESGKKDENLLLGQHLPDNGIKLTVLTSFVVASEARGNCWSKHQATLSQWPQQMNFLFTI